MLEFKKYLRVQDGQNLEIINKKQFTQKKISTWLLGFLTHYALGLFLFFCIDCFFKFLLLVYVLWNL